MNANARREEFEREGGTRWEVVETPIGRTILGPIL